MKVIVGLGNPGIKHVNNRHNVGHMVVDELASVKVGPSKSASKGPTFRVLKSDKFMNSSGSFVLKLTNRYILNPSHLYIVHDDLDIPLGSFKIQFGKGPKGHNGILDIEEKLGTSEFWRVRVGVDNRLQGIGDRLQGEQYVLEDFTDEEKLILSGVIKQICNQLSQ